ncbi:Dihydrolipoyl dehydrogenase [compost metagenome]
MKTGVFPLQANAKSMIMGESSGLVKYVVDAGNDEILGLHIAGPRATDIIVEGALAIRLEATLEELVTTIHAHPTVGEALHEAAHAVHNRAIHLHV